MILYFSGTGNSKYLAEFMAQRLEQKIFSINEGLKMNLSPDLTKEDDLIFVVPVYAWRIPRVVEQWILSNIEGQNKRAYFIINCGDSIGNSHIYAEELCKRKNFRYMGTAEIVMPENYILMFNCPSKEKSLEIVNRAEEVIQPVVELIRRCESLRERRNSFIGRMQSGFVNWGFYRFYIKSRKFRTTKVCIGCGKCEAICPLNNIRMEEGRPIWGDSCTHCVACICHCPTEAIEYGKISVGKRRYRCPK